MADLSVNIKDLKLKNPVMTASGTFGYGLEFADFVPLEEIGGIIVKGTTLEPREGNDYPRMAETPQGMLNCVGLQNKGVDYFCEHIYPQIKDIDTNMIVNVSGHSPESYAECAARINELEKIPAIELNISCPNVKLLGEIGHFDFRGYNYDIMTIDGLYKNGGFDGQFLLDDENALVSAVVAILSIDLNVIFAVNAYLHAYPSMTFK